MKLLKALGFGSQPKTQNPPAFEAPVRPGETFVAVGDVHGCADLLSASLGNIAVDSPDAKIVCVGDYIDRGENSADVLRLLLRHSAEAPEKFCCLLGNHEYMLINFLKDPEKHGPAWFKYGGLQTIASFGVGFGSGRDFKRVHLDLALAMGSEMIDWLGTLPAYWITGNIAVTHAGADPYRPIDDQSRRALLWGHSDFLSTPRSDGIWVVHGHTIVQDPTVEQGRIAIDTGAYATGRLTAVRISSDSVSFMETT